MRDPSTSPADATMVLVQILLPLRSDDGKRLPQHLYAEVRDELTGRFGGVTAFHNAPALGKWKDEDGEVDRDEVVMYEVMVEGLEREWWARYRGALETRFGQRELVIRAVEIERL